MANLGLQLASSAANLISTYGTTMEFISKVATYVPGTGQVSTVSTSQTLKGVVKKLIWDWEGNETIKAGDLQVMVAASGLTAVPKPGDTLTFGEQVYSIVDVQPQYAIETLVAWNLQVRK